ncbi:NmrA family NAD(P)-binding protein [Panacibacter sp. DH6]|uniref:NmrA family NAD(P)-binding protein n=1 Tax=Panacibacter microcysteis TaxID=2793269 RepID=A0A931E135_9BACT|nr:NmrA family NAD(P)-binding protein [Panacibacter microcysteis]MBG9376687.1 NmrA family NAD(P)-binding protein [Panacibacter microcysteis]
MHYIITGSTGHISSPLTKALIAAGHTATVITSRQNNVAAIEALGAKAAVGSVEDVQFLKDTFAGADAVYTMVPPNFGAAEWKKWIGSIGRNYTEAIKATGIKYVVNLSSVGAHLPDGVGPVSGLYLVEQSLNTLSDVNVKHLRPAYFYDNLYANIGLIKQAGIIGSNFNVNDKKFVLVDTADIAAVAAKALLELNFTGHSYEYIASDEVSTADIAGAIGNAIGKPALPWVPFTDEQAFEGMVQAGLSKEIAANYTEMGHAVNSGTMYEDYWKNHTPVSGKTKLHDFAKIFATAYNAG